VLVVAAAAVAILVYALPEGKGHAVAWSELRVGPLTLTDSQRRLFRNRAAFARFLLNADSKHPAPRIDFAKRQLLLVSPGPRSSTGYSVEILSVTERDEEITVKVRERTPTLAERVKPGVTNPYRLLSLPAGEDVFVDWIGR
jgi:hypothetical protein